MRIVIVAPVRPGSTSGNDVTAARWRRRLGELGHDVEIAAMPPDPADDGDEVRDGSFGSADVVIALHARRCARAVRRSVAARPDRPVVVGLAGTDLYVDLPDDPATRTSVDVASALVVLQSRAVDRLASFDSALAAKATVVPQSVELPELSPVERAGDEFVVVVLAHLRDVKDPLLAARAARLLPDDSRVVVRHAGAAHDDAWAAAATAEMGENPRYEWLGERSRIEALELLAGADVLACTSVSEGGANVVSEAIALGVPVIGTDIDGTRGILGDDHPGLVPVGDAAALAEMIRTVETDDGVRADARDRVVALQHLVEPATERAAWARVLGGLV